MHEVCDGFEPIVTDPLAVLTGHVARVIGMAHDVIDAYLINQLAADRLKGVT